MRKRTSRRGQRRRSRRGLEEQASEPAETPRGTVSANTRTGAFYDAGPVLGLATATQQPTPGTQTGTHQRSVEVSLSATHGTGQHHEQVAYGRTLRLEGRTDVSYDGGRFRTENVRVHSAERCQECGGRERIHVTGTLVATYRVRTRVTLPRASDFPGLTPCQRQRVQDAIANVLAPHEQEHVQAAEQYNGVTRQPFDLTLCRDAFDAEIRAMFQSEETARRASAEQAFRLLDPFYFDVDLDCDEASAGAGGGVPAGEPAAMARAETPAPETPAAEEAAAATQTGEPVRAEQSA